MRVTLGLLAVSLFTITVGCKDVSDPVPPDAANGSSTDDGLSAAVASTHKRWHVATNGSSGGDGSASRPWDLKTALAGPGAVQPGDTVYLRAGTYRGSYTAQIHGTSSSPVVVRQYPNEKAKLDGNILVRGAYTWYWGFEITNSNLSVRDVTGMNVQAPGVKVINMVIHDASGNGIGAWAEAPGAELYGNIVYNNGRTGSDVGRHGHGIYFQNSSGTKLLQHNVVFNSYSYNFHGYGGSVPVNNVTLDGNISFNAGQFVDYGGDEYTVQSPENPVRNLNFTGNVGYRGGAYARVDIGADWSGVTNAAGSRVTGNYLAGWTRINYWDGITVSGNTFIGTQGWPAIRMRKQGGTSFGRFSWNSNQYAQDAAMNPLFYLSSGSSGSQGDLPWWQRTTGWDNSSSFTGKPSGAKVFVFRNKYEKGRANVAVFNWSRAGSVSVDLSTVLSSGQSYEIRNVQTMGSVAASGTYRGGSVSLPMGSVAATRPLGSTSRAAGVTGPLFNAFVVVPMQ